MTQQLKNHHISGVTALLRVGNTVWSAGDKTARVWDPQVCSRMKRRRGEPLD
jgi:hypothetical protein